MDDGVLIMCGLKAEAVLNSVDIIISQFAMYSKSFKTVDDYDVGNVSHKVVKIILSYIDYVNRIVWRKNF